MRQIRILTAAMFVVFAFAVIAVSTAQAEGPFFSECAKKPEKNHAKNTRGS
jgi:hypothetical protein